MADVNRPDAVVQRWTNLVGAAVEEDPSHHRTLVLWDGEKTPTWEPNGGIENLGPVEKRIRERTPK